MKDSKSLNETHTFQSRRCWLCWGGKRPKDQRINGSNDPSTGEARAWEKDEAGGNAQNLFFDRGTPPVGLSESSSSASKGIRIVSARQDSGSGLGMRIRPNGTIQPGQSGFVSAQKQEKSIW